MTDLLAVLVLIGVPAGVLLTVRMLNLRYEREPFPTVGRPGTPFRGAGRYGATTPAARALSSMRSHADSPATIRTIAPAMATVETAQYANTE